MGTFYYCADVIKKSLFAFRNNLVEQGDGKEND